MSGRTISALIGNIKRNYPKGDFNPFETMEFIYDNCLVRGEGSRVVVIGYSERFGESIVSAMFHVMASRKILTKEPIPYPIDDRVTSHTGTIIKFANIKDSVSEREKLLKELNETDIAVFCNKYHNPTIKQILRSKEPVVQFYDSSNNNVDKPKKEVVR